MTPAPVPVKDATGEERQRQAHDDGRLPDGRDGQGYGDADEGHPQEEEGQPAWGHRRAVAYASPMYPFRSARFRAAPSLGFSVAWVSNTR